MSGQFLSLFVAGGLDALTYWSLAFLIASGLTVVFGMLGFLNIAHASFYMLAGYIALSIAGATGSFWLALADGTAGYRLARPGGGAHLVPPPVRGRPHPAIAAHYRPRLRHRRSDENDLGR